MPHDTNALDRSEALLERATLSPDEAADALPELVDLLGNDDPSVRVNAAWAIGHVVHANPGTIMQVIPGIIPYLDVPEYRWDVARVLAYLAEEFRAETKTALVETASDDERDDINPFLAKLRRKNADISARDVFVLDTLAERRARERDETDAIGRPPHARLLRDESGSESGPATADTDEQEDDEKQTESGRTPPESIERKLEGTLSEIRLDTRFDSLDLVDVVAAHEYAAVCKVLAVDDTGQHVRAVKIFGDPLDDRAFTETFGRRVDRWQRFAGHEHVVTVHEYGLSPRPWIAVDFVDGGDLTQMRGTLSDRVERARALIEAVATAHGHGCLHTGLKPRNVLFTSTLTGRSDTLRITDWGLAKPIFETTRDRRHLNPKYAAPEYLDPAGFGTIDQFTDCYHLGALLYRLFTDRAPFVGKLHGVMRQVLSEEPTPPKQVRDGLPAGLSNVIEKALSKNKFNRYESVGYLRRDFEDALEGTTK